MVMRKSVKVGSKCVLVAGDTAIPTLNNNNELQILSNDQHTLHMYALAYAATNGSPIPLQVFVSLIRAWEYSL